MNLDNVINVGFVIMIILLRMAASEKILTSTAANERTAQTRTVKTSHGKILPTTISLPTPPTNPKLTEPSMSRQERRKQANKWKIKQNSKHSSPTVEPRKLPDQIRHRKSRTKFTRTRRKMRPGTILRQTMSNIEMDTDISTSAVPTETYEMTDSTMSSTGETTQHTSVESDTDTDPFPKITHSTKSTTEKYLEEEFIYIDEYENQNDNEINPDGRKSETEEDIFQKIEKSVDEVSDPIQTDPNKTSPNLDVVTHFLHIIESQHLLGKNCSPGVGFNLGEGVVEMYGQKRFRREAEVAVNRANWLTRIWKYASAEVLQSEYLLHSSLFSMIELDEDIFAAGNCYDKGEYKSYFLFCPFAYRLPEGPILAKDLAVEYKYLSNDSEFFISARNRAKMVISNNTSFMKGEFTNW